MELLILNLVSKKFSKPVLKNKSCLTKRTHSGYTITVVHCLIASYIASEACQDLTTTTVSVFCFCDIDKKQLSFTCVRKRKYNLSKRQVQDTNLHKLYVFSNCLISRDKYLKYKISRTLPVSNDSFWKLAFACRLTSKYKETSVFLDFDRWFLTFAHLSLCCYASVRYFHWTFKYDIHMVSLKLMFQRTFGPNSWNNFVEPKLRATDLGVYNFLEKFELNKVVVNFFNRIHKTSLTQVFFRTWRT